MVECQVFEWMNLVVCQTFEWMIQSNTSNELNPEKESSLQMAWGVRDVLDLSDIADGNHRKSFALGLYQNLEPHEKSHDLIPCLPFPVKHMAQLQAEWPWNCFGTHTHTHTRKVWYDKTNRRSPLFSGEFISQLYICKHVIYIYILGCWSKFLYPGTAILRE